MLIEGRKISLFYDMNKDEKTCAFKDIDICLNTHEMVGLMGPSGCGKSSLLYVLSGLRKPTAGTVYYDDVDIEAFSQIEKAKIRKSKFGFIFQRHFLIDYLTVMDNVLAAVNRSDIETKMRVQELLDKLKIGHLADKKPFQLSGGQRQRTAIARALINNPGVIFADEPTASLDHESAREVMNVLEEYSDRAVIFIVTHDRSILKKADRIVEIWDGQIK